MRSSVSERRRRARFARIVREALDSIPEEFHPDTHNVAVIIADEPDARQRRENEHPDELLGLYEGVPRTERFSGEPFLPDRITIFRRAIERISASPARQRQIIRDTVVHEVAHHLGISDERLDELGLGDEQ